MQVTRHISFGGFVLVLLLVAISIVALQTVTGQVFHTGNADNLMDSSKGSDIASAATIAPTHRVHNVTGITTVNTITVPAKWQPGALLVVIPKGLFITGVSGNIALGSIAVVDRAIIFVWDGVKWFPIS